MPSGGPGAVDIRDPRIRVTFADVAMRIARDGPMYGVIVLVGVLAMTGKTTTMESIVGAALALQARSHPPPEDHKGSRIPLVMGGLGLLLFAHVVTACL